MGLTLLIDADVYAYRAAASAEEVTNWGDETDDGCQWAVTADEPKARQTFRDELAHLMDHLQGTAYILALSDSSANWRKDVLPTYKGNRTAARKPIILPHVRQWVRDEFGDAVWERPKLEGDDLLGILSGLRDRIVGDRVMVTIDKDLSTIPGSHYRPHREVLGIFDVDVATADRFHLMQGIAGDPTDGYSGCPGWGMKTAEEWLDDPYELVPEKFTQHKGKYAGIERTRWVKRPTTDLWAGILSLYAKEGLTEEDALQQFRVARILRTTDYDFQKKEPILWRPSTTFK